MTILTFSIQKGQKLQNSQISFNFFPRFLRETQSRPQTTNRNQIKSPKENATQILTSMRKIR